MSLWCCCLVVWASCGAALRLNINIKAEDSNHVGNDSPHIIVSRFCEDVEWATSMQTPVTIMQSETAACRDKQSHTPSQNVTVEMRPNFGHEASAYLQFMITHYEKLPATMIFTQGHENSWHQELPMKPLITKKLQQLQEMKLDYLTLNNFFGHEGPTLKTKYEVKGVDHIGGAHEGMKGDFFETAIKQFYATSREYTNMVLDNGKCAQFIIKRELLSRIPKHVLETWRLWLLKGHDSEGKEDEWSNFWTGRMFEFWWPFILNPNNLKQETHQNGTKQNMHLMSKDSPEIPHLYEYVEGLRSERKGI